MKQTLGIVNLLGQSPKVRRHKAMLALVLLILFPFALVAIRALGAAMFSDSPPEGIGNTVVLIVLLGFPPALLVVGAFLLSRLRDGFSHSTRKRLFGFYVCLLAYCGFWLTAFCGGGGFSPFAVLEVLMVSLVLALPAFVTMYSTAEAEQASTLCDNGDSGG